MTTAKVLEGANLVWQRVNEFMLTVDGSPVSKRTALVSLKTWLATQKGNPKLQYIPFNHLTDEDNLTVPEITTGGCSLHAIFAKKISGTSTTAAWFKLNDSATLCGDANGANTKIGIPLKNSGDEFFLMYNPPFPIATGIVLAGQTDYPGASATSAADETSGFLLVG